MSRSVLSAKVKLMLAASLLPLSFACLSISATGADKTLTPAQYAQKSAEFLRYQKTIQAQFVRQERATYQQKMQLVAQRKAKEAADGSTANKTPHRHVPIRREDVLLVMPAKGATGRGIREAIEGAHGEICGRLGAGGLCVFLVKAQPGKVAELQRVLAADTKNFKHVDFNRKHEAMWIPGTEPSMPKAWHMYRMRICDAWDIVEKYNFAFPQCVAVFDTGTGSFEPWLAGAGADTTKTVGNGKVDDLGIDFDGDLATGIDAEDIADMEEDIIEIGNNIKTLTYGCTDTHGHGTWVSSTINGSAYNRLGAAGVNPQVPVYPIRIANIARGMQGGTDSLSLIKAMCVMYDCLGTHIINISYGDCMGASNNEVLHEFFKDWYYRKNGLVFVSAGNAGENLSMANQPYVNCVSAMGNVAGMKLAKTSSWQSASGTAVDFTAPGQNIQVVDIDNNPKTVSGTSFASPIVAGVASMIWHINGKLKNSEVEKIMRDNCENTDGANAWNPKFGWGMPDAYKCAQDAEASRKK